MMDRPLRGGDLLVFACQGSGVVTTNVGRRDGALGVVDWFNVFYCSAIYVLARAFIEIRFGWFSAVEVLNCAAIKVGHNRLYTRSQLVIRCRYCLV